MEERIVELMPEDAKAVLLLLARSLPYEVTQAMDRTETSSPDALRSGVRRWHLTELLRRRLGPRAAS